MNNKIPSGAQFAFYPMKDCTISAGYQNAKYKEDPAHPFEHLGMDFDSLNTTSFNALASGNGTVLGVEMNQYSSIGGVAVVKYQNVYLPKTGQIKDLIFRYLHLESVQVVRGASVSPYSVIGIVSGSHKWWNHLHVEIDTDTSHPFHTPQVSETSSALLIRSGADTSTMLDPADVFVLGKAQTCRVHPMTIYTGFKDIPRYRESDFSDEPQNPPNQVKPVQRLILPVNQMKITAGYKNPKYLTLKVGTHYGMDCSGPWAIYGSGNGTVLLSGTDRVLGNIVIVRYENVLNHKTNQAGDIVMRYHHLASWLVNAGDRITKDTKIGVMGNTGLVSTGVHLHLECDTDTKSYRYTPTLSGNTNLMKAGARGEKDTTFNPAEVLHCKTSAPDNQTVTRTMDGYTSAADLDIPNIL